MINWWEYTERSTPVRSIMVFEDTKVLPLLNYKGEFIEVQNKQQIGFISSEYFENEGISSL